MRKLALLIPSVILAACGGDSTGTPGGSVAPAPGIRAPLMMPADALTVSGFISFTQSLFNAGDLVDRLEPYAIPQTPEQVDDSSEPRRI